MRKVMTSLLLAVAVFTGNISASTAAEQARKQEEPSFLERYTNVAQDVILQGLKFVGVRYRWGGNTEDSGLDCSGFVRLVFKDTLGTSLPRTAREMSVVGQQIDFSPDKGMVVLDVEAHFNDDAIQTEGGGCVDEVSNTHRRDHLVETLMHEFGHVLQDYFGQELHHVAIDRICDDYRKRLDEYRHLTHDFPGQHALSCWFGLSYASFLVLPRVLMEAMDDPWKERMAVLLKEFDQEFVNVPSVNFTVRVTDDDNRMVKTPEWMLNYRHPDRALINSFRKQEAYAKKLQEADNG